MGRSSSLPLTRIIPACFKTGKSWFLLVSLFWGLLILLFLFFSSPASGAMSLSFSGAPLSVVGEEEFEVQAVLASAPQNRNYYLRAAFFKQGTIGYFGFTLNNQGEWHGEAGEYDSFLKISTGDQGEWQGVLRAKADLTGAGFEDPGEYFFKLGRYTEGGTLSWSDNQAEVVILVDPSPVPTPTSSPTPTPISTLAPSSTPEPSFSPAPTIAPTPTPYINEGIILNEIMVWPVEGEEWVEIKNTNDFDVYLTGWFLDDIPDGGTKPFQFSLKIPSGGLEVIQAGTRFNNSGDLVRLIGQSGELIDSYPYDSIKKGYSFAKDKDGNWQITSDPTPGEENKIVGLATATPFFSPDPSPTVSPTIKPLPSPSFSFSPPPTVFNNQPGLILGSANHSAEATESGQPSGRFCPFVEELEKELFLSVNSFSEEGLEVDQVDREKFPGWSLVSLLGLGTMTSSLGFFLKEVGVLVK